MKIELNTEFNTRVAAIQWFSHCGCDERPEFGIPVQWVGDRSTALQSMFSSQWADATTVAMEQGPLSIRGGGVKSNGGPGAAVVAGEAATLYAEIENRSTSTTGHLAFTIRRPDGLAVASLSTLRDLTPVTLREGISCISAVANPLLLTSGRYEIGATLYTVEGLRLTECAHAFDLQVQSREDSPGLLLIPHEWRQH